MQTVLVVGSLLPAGIGLGCCLHRRHWCGLIAMVAMIGGMTDATLLGHRLLPEAGWVVVFAVAAAAQFLAAEPTRVMRIAELGVMSLLMVAMPSTTTEAMDGMHHHMGHAGMSAMSTASPSGAPMLIFFSLVAAVAYLEYAASRLVLEEAASSRLELGMSVASVAVMSTMMLL